MKKKYKIIKQPENSLRNWKEGFVMEEDYVIDGKPASYWLTEMKGCWEEIKEKDNINPDHYKQGKIECIDTLEAGTVNKTGLEAVCTANIIKYLWRYESKNGIEDVKKARWYLEKLIKHLEND